MKKHVSKMMNTKIIFYGFLVSLMVSFGFACKSQKGTDIQNSKSSSDSLVMSINRYPCFGRCPYYEASIYQSGYATIDRKGFMEDLGLYATRFSKQEIQNLLDEAKRINYESMPDSFYNPGIADFPATITSVTLHGKRKTIFNGVPEAPKELNLFEQNLSNLVTNPEIKWTLIRKKEAE